MEYLTYSLRFHLVVGIIIFVSVLSPTSSQFMLGANGNQCPQQMPNFCFCGQANVTCNCSSNDTVILNDVYQDRIQIEMNGCRWVSVPPGAFRNSRRALVLTFNNVSNIRLMSGSFERDASGDTRVTITLHNSHAREIPRETFSTFGRQISKPLLTLNIINSRVDRMASGSLGNFTIKMMKVVNSIMGIIETRTMDNPLDGKLKFVNNTFQHLQENAFVIHNVSTANGFLIEGNTFEGNISHFLVGTLGGDAYIINNTFPVLHTSPWNLNVGGDVLISQNTFPNIPLHGIQLKAAGSQIRLEGNNIQHLQARALQLIEPTGRKTIIFIENNTIGHHDPMSLCLHEAFRPSTVVIKHTYFMQPCLCNITVDIARALGLQNLTLQNLYRDGIHEQWFRGGECVLGELSGKKTKSVPHSRHVPIDQYLVHSCLGQQRPDSVILLVFAFILIIIATCVILAWRRLKRRTTIDPSSANSDYRSFTEPAPPSTTGSAWMMIQPDPRMYQETEIHILFDKAEEIDATKGDSTADDTQKKGEGDKGRKEDTVGEKEEMLDTKSTASVRQSCPPIPFSK